MKSYSDFTQFDDMVNVDDTVIDVWIESLPVTENWITEHARLSSSFVGMEEVKSRYAQLGDKSTYMWYHFRDTRSNIIGDMVCCGDVCRYCFSAYVLKPVTNKM